MNNPEILKQIIESRKSTYPKDYTGEEISQETLDEILSSAQFAPNHKKTKLGDSVFLEVKKNSNWQKKFRKFIKQPRQNTCF